MGPAHLICMLAEAFRQNAEAFGWHLASHEVPSALWVPARVGAKRRSANSNVAAGATARGDYYPVPVHLLCGRCHLLTRVGSLWPVSEVGHVALLSAEPSSGMERRLFHPPHVSSSIVCA